MREIEIVILLLIQVENKRSYIISYPAFWSSPSVAVDKAHVSLFRILLLESDNLPPTDSKSLCCFLVADTTICQQTNNPHTL